MGTSERQTAAVQRRTPNAGHRTTLVLGPLSVLYGSIARSRRRGYTSHPERQRRLRQPVISVGNISVGGSGKTPAVAHIARLLIAAGERPAILTRGYRRREATDGVLVVSDGRRIRADLPRAGDEPLMLARALPGAGVFVSADRHLAGLLAERRFNCSVHLLDDGFQHVQLHRDIDIVLVTPEDLHDRVLPAGRLREELPALARADAIVVNADGDVDAQAVAAQTGVAAVFQATTRLGALHLAAGAGPFDVAHKVLALAGIARPRRFFDLLAASGWRVVGEMAFADHHWFTRSDLDRIVRAVRDGGAEFVVTTEKDLVRLLPLRPFPVPVAAAPLEFDIEHPGEAGSGGARFREWLAARLAAARSAPAMEQPA
jgi:tetraacyldisaccharide 4'-kinase